MHDRFNAPATTQSPNLRVAMPAHRLRAVLLSAALVATALAWPTAAAAADNLAPVAVDDPGTSCQPAGAFGGAFPIPEDWGRFDFVGQCSAIANDTDSDGTIVAWQIVTQPAHGTLEYLPDFPGIFGYTPDPDFSTAEGDWVSDSFTYQVIDDLDALSNVATMRFWIAPINDAPFFTSVPPDPMVDENSGPYEVSWLPYISAGAPNESDQTVEFVITHVESHGVVSLFSEPPTFTPDGRLTFTPGPDEHGYAIVTGYLHDNGGLQNYGIPNLPEPPDDTSDPFTFMIFVNAANADPVAVDDDATVAEDSGANTIDVLANDSDPDGDTFWITEATDGAQGSVALAGAATLTYTPNPDANGSDSFTYTIRDVAGATSTATVNVTISPVNDSPTATDDGVPTRIAIPRGSGPVQIAVLTNDSSGPDEGEDLWIVAVTRGAIGAVAISPGGLTLTYDPDHQNTGLDSFTYTISDGNGGFDTAIVYVSVTKAKGPK